MIRVGSESTPCLWDSKFLEKDPSDAFSDVDTLQEDTSTFKCDEKLLNQAATSFGMVVQSC